MSHKVGVNKEEKTGKQAGISGFQLENPADRECNNDVPD